MAKADDCRHKKTLLRPVLTGTREGLFLYSEELISAQVGFENPVLILQFFFLAMFFPELFTGFFFFALHFTHPFLLISENFLFLLSFLI